MRPLIVFVFRYILRILYHVVQYLHKLFDYRLDRWMMTPLYRKLIIYGTPAIVIFALGSAYLANDARRQAIADSFDAAASAITDRPEFMVTQLEINGSNAELTDQINRQFTDLLPRSSFDIELSEVMANVKALGPVKDAAVRIKTGGILEIDVDPRVPVAVWRHNDGVSTVDIDGVIIADLPERTTRPDLPLIVREGANKHVVEALALLRAAGPLAKAVRGIVRVSERRWDIVLMSNQRILLPEENPATSLARVVILAQSRELFDRDVSVVDMRDPEKPVIRSGKNIQANADRVNVISAEAGN